MHLSKSRKVGESKQARVKNVLESVASGIISSLNEIQPHQNDPIQCNENVPTAENTSVVSNSIINLYKVLF